MRSILYNLITVAVVSSLAACGGGHSHEGEHEGHDHDGHAHNEVNPELECELIYNPDSTKISWTAYKTTEKIAVGGTFDHFKMGGVKEGYTVAQVFENVKFMIESASVNSNNEDRDRKIHKHFFMTMAQGVEIVGTVDEIGDDHAEVFINMNGFPRKQKFDLKTDNETYCTISADLDLEGWNALESVNALNEVCFDLHKGADGESKLWSEVHVELTVKLDKICP